MLGFNNLDSIFAKPKANNQVRIKKGLNALQQTNDASIEGKDYVREQGFSTIIDKSTTSKLNAFMTCCPTNPVEPVTRILGFFINY